MEVTYCWCVAFFRTSLLLAPLDLCTYGYGVPPRPGPPASLAGGVFYWLCGTDLFAQQGAERLLFRYPGREGEEGSGGGQGGAGEEGREEEEGRGGGQGMRAVGEGRGGGH